MLSNISINNISYDWKDIEVHFIMDIETHSSPSSRNTIGQDTGLNFGSYKPAGVSSINYTTNRAIEYDYSRTGFAVARKFGRFEASADITLDYYELNVIKNKLFDIFQNIKPIDIKIVYTSGNQTHIDTLYGCIMSYPDNVGGNQNDIGLEANINLNPVWIKYETV